MKNYLKCMVISCAIFTLNVHGMVPDFVNFADFDILDQPGRVTFVMENARSGNEDTFSALKSLHEREFLITLTAILKERAAEEFSRLLRVMDKLTRREVINSLKSDLPDDSSGKILGGKLDEAVRLCGVEQRSEHFAKKCALSVPVDTSPLPPPPEREAQKKAAREQKRLEKRELEERKKREEEERRIRQGAAEKRTAQLEREKKERQEVRERVEAKKKKKKKIIAGMQEEITKLSKEEMAEQHSPVMYKGPEKAFSFFLSIRDGMFEIAEIVIAMCQMVEGLGETYKFARKEVAPFSSSANEIRNEVLGQKLQLSELDSRVKGAMSDPPSSVEGIADMLTLAATADESAAERTTQLCRLFDRTGELLASANGAVEGHQIFQGLCFEKKKAFFQSKRERKEKIDSFHHNAEKFLSRVSKKD